MEDIFREMDRLCERKREETKDEIGNMVTRHQFKLMQRVIEILEDTVKGIRPSQVETYINNHLIIELMKRFRDYAEKNYDNIKTLNSSMLRMSDEKTPDKLTSLMSYELHEATRRLNIEEIGNIGLEFTDGFTRRLSNFIQKNNLMSYNATEEAMYQIKHYLPRRLSEIINEIFDEYYYYFKHEMDTYENRFEEYMKEEERKQKEKAEAERKARKMSTIPDLKGNRELIERCGLIIEETVDGLQVTNPATSTPVKLNKLGNNLLITDDKSYAFNIGGQGRFSIINNDMILSIDDKGLSYGYKATPKRVRVIFDDNKQAHFYFFNEEQFDPTVVGIIMDELIDKFPAIHKEFMNNPSYAAVLNEAEERIKSNNALIKDEDGSIKFDPNNRDKYHDIIASCGIKMVEKEDGIYFYVAGEEKKARGERTLSVEGVDNFYFKPNFYIINDKSISGPYFEFKINSVNCVIPQDYSAINIFIDDVHYASRIDEEGNIRYFAHKKKEQVCSDEEAKAFISETVPGLFAKNIEYRDSLFARANSQADEEVRELLDELDTPQNIGTSTPEQEEQVSIDEELATLMEDPKVQRYIELMNLKKQQEGVEAPSGPRM